MAQEWSGERLETFVYNEATIEHLHRYAIAVGLVRNKDILDIASGEGYGSNLLSMHARTVTGIDNDKTTILHAINKYKKNNLKFIAGDATDIPLADHSVDVVVSFETIEHLTEHHKMMREIKRVLRPEGILVISTPEKRNYSDLPGYNNPYHAKELYEGEFRELISGYFLNSQLVRQVSATTSIITTDRRDAFQLYKGDFHSITTINNIDPVYLIEIASDGIFHPVLPSIFIGESIFQQALRNKENDVKRTISYRIGHFILSPLKFVRRLFR